MCVRKLATCLVVLVVALGRRGAAQGGNIPIEETTPLTISGFAVGTGMYDRNLAQNRAMASKLALSLFRPWSDQLYLFAQLTTHVAVHDSEPAHTHVEIDNLIVNWTPARLSALSLSFGRFDAPIGFERDDEPLNLIPTSSFTLENARPVKFTGLAARYTVNPKISVLGLVANGWDQEADNNSGKTAGLKVQLFPTSGLAIAAGAFYGPEEDSTNSAQRTLLTGDATWQPMQRLVLQAEAHRGSQPGVNWSAVVGQAFWRAGRSTGLTVRGEVFDDPDGVRTGTAQTMRSLTISPWYFYREAQEGVFSNVEFTSFRLPAFSIRPALRLDHSSQPVFETKDGSLKQSNLTAVVELVFVF
jgi:putative OmpL-like beta-barrel porin-2